MIVNDIIIFVVIEKIQVEKLKMPIDNYIATQM